MTFQTYTKCCLKTLSCENPDVELHCAIGLATESGEILDAYKKSRFYGRELNKQNVKEEIGDVLWYLSILMDSVNYTLEDAMSDNINKLSKRYPSGFMDVLVRDKEKELNHIKG